MNKIEIETIVTGLSVKQSWVRKSWRDFLDAWKEATAHHPSLLSKCVVAEIETDKVKKFFYLVPNDSRLWREEYDNYGIWEDPAICDPSVSFIRRITKNLEATLAGYFKAVQEEIEENSIAGQALQSIIEKLS